MKFLMTIAATAALSAVTTLGASASTLTIGSLTIEDTAFADTAALVNGSLNGTVPANAIGASFGTTSAFFANLQATSNDVLELGFTDNTLGNGVGNDLVIFEGAQPQVPSISLSLNGSSILGTLLERPVIPGTTSSQMNAYVFDLADLGLADGEQISSIFIKPAAGEFNLNVIAAAALNPGGDTAVIPLPAGGLLLITGLGAIGIFRRRTHG